MKKTANQLVPYARNQSKETEGPSNTPRNIPKGKKKRGDSLEADQTVRIDTLTLTAGLASPASLDRVIADLEDVFQQKFELYPGTKFSGKEYTGGWANSPYGMKIYWDSFEEATARPTCRIHLTGETLSRVELVDLVMFFYGLVKETLDGRSEILTSITCTRIDIAIDDYTQSLYTEEDLHQAYKQGNIVKLRNTGHQSHYSGDPSVPETYGWTHEWGKGRKRIVFYNKEAQTKGEIKSYRIEGRYYEKDADILFKEMLNPEMSEVIEELPTFLVNAVVGICEFMEFPNSRKHGVRDGKRLPWWQKVVDLATDIVRYSHKKPKSNIEKKVNWIDFQVANSLAMLREVLGISLFYRWFDRMLDDRKRRESTSYQTWVETAKIDKDMYREAIGAVLDMQPDAVSSV